MYLHTAYCVLRTASHLFSAQLCTSVPLYRLDRGVSAHLQACKPATHHVRTCQKLPSSNPAPSVPDSMSCQVANQQSSWPQLGPRPSLVRLNGRWRMVRLCWSMFGACWTTASSSSFLVAVMAQKAESRKQKAERERILHLCKDRLSSRNTLRSNQNKT
jgi:hypothetical protein